MKQHPLLYEVNTRLLLNELRPRRPRQATLDDLPEAIFDSLHRAPFDAVWLLGVWRTGPAGVAVSRGDRKIRRAISEALPDASDRDIAGSPFAVYGYDVRAEWGGQRALARLRERFAERGMHLILDFVPNHVALDHPWLDEHPEYFIHGSEEDLAREPDNYVRVRSRRRELVLAHGRDPHFPGWADTLQLNYRHAGLRRAMTEQLLRVARMCDGVRCDMAMLALPDVFERTWGERSQPRDGSEPARGSFWAEAIAAVRREHPGFAFIAEAYWDLEWRLQREGFDFTYDKTLYDRLREGWARGVREHLLADPEYQRRSVRFLENHDEPRAAAVFPPEVHRAAAIITYLVPGLRFFHEGQFQGRRAQVPLHVGRRPVEAPDRAIERFYTELLDCSSRREVHDGDFRLHVRRPAWDGNRSFEDLIAFSWTLREQRLLVAVNFSAHRSQGYVGLDVPGLGQAPTVTLADLMGAARYERRASELMERGLYLDLPAWGYHVFDWRQG